MTALKPWGKDCTVSNPAFKHSPLSTVWPPNWHIRHAPDEMRAGSVDMASKEKISIAMFDRHGYVVVL
jgi:hypothetical protein